ncbi:unnamed protein product [Victoria cruziana]
MAPTSQPSDGFQSSAKSVAVVGAGISGLVAAYQLKSHGLKVTLFESNEHPGGKITTHSENGIIWEEGANTMTESDDAVGRLLDGLCLREKQQFPISQTKRYIVKNGKAVLVPSNPLALIQSKFLSSKSKLQIMMEPFLMGRSDRKTSPSEVPGQDLSESVGMFFRRHFGQEVVDYLIDPFVAGTSGGDPESLSMHLAFPQIFQLEKMYGSIILGLIKSKFSKRGVEKGERIASRGKRKYSRGSFSFQGGLQVLTDKLCNELTDDSLKLHSKVLSLSYNHEEGSPSNSWLVSYTSKPANGNIPRQGQTFDAIVMTAPLCNVQQMQIEKMGRPFLLDFLPKANYVPLSVIVTTFKKEDVRFPLEGFGVLVPSKEQENGLKTLGTIFSSMMFPDRAPSDQYLYTTFIGGTRNRDLAGASLDELRHVVSSDLNKLLGVEGQPTSIRHVYWKDAFPVYGHDYDRVIEAIQKMEAGLPGFFYAGNHRGGLSVGNAISSGFKAADLAVAYLSSQNVQTPDHFEPEK